MDPVSVNFMKWLSRRYKAPAWMPEAPRRAAASLAQQLKHRFHRRVARRAVSGKLASLGDVKQFLLEQHTALKLPIVLVSQVQRSGGSLLSQLFDGHPQLAAYPQELRFGDKDTDQWPTLDPTFGPDETFFALMDHNFPRLVRRGMTKGYRNPDRHLFALITRLEYALFKKLWDESPPSRPRDITDHYFTAFFHAWLNFQGDLKQKTWITAFAPRLAREETSATRYFEIYPDGRLIQILRDPMTWFPSAMNHVKSGSGGVDRDRILSKWFRSTEAILRNRNLFGDKVIVLRFEDVVGRTEPTMRTLCNQLNVRYDPVLLQPTFNGHLMLANSSFDVQETGMTSQPLTRAELLSSEERKFLDRQCSGLYQRALAEAIVIDETADVLSVGTG